MSLSFYTQLNEVIDASVDTFAVLSATGLPTKGVISINNEIILYTGVDLSDPTLPVLTGCVRGFASSTAGEHQEGAQVNLVGLYYPSSVQTREDLFIATNNFSTTTPGIVGAGQIDIPIANADRLPPSGMVSIDQEIIFYSFIDEGNAYPVLRNCIRGFDGTVSKEHGVGSKVEVRWVARHHNLLAEAILLLQGALGANPAGSYPDLTARLERQLPSLIVWTADGPAQVGQPGAKVNVTVTVAHDKRRLVGVQIWRKTGTNKYEEMEVPLEQTVSTGGSSTVSFILMLGAAAHEEGYVVFS
jgi:hypothetical protein